MKKNDPLILSVLNNQYCNTMQEMMSYLNHPVVQLAHQGKIAQARKWILDTSFSADFMVQMLAENEVCKHEASIIRIAVMKKGISESDIQYNENSHCFRVDCRHGWHVSVSVSSDLMGNRIFGYDDMYDRPICAETLLFKDGKMEYNDEWGYDDIIRFYDPNNTGAGSPENIVLIMREIGRIRTLVRWEKGLEPRVRKKVMRLFIMMLVLRELFVTVSYKPGNSGFKKVKEEFCDMSNLL